VQFSFGCLFAALITVDRMMDTSRQEKMELESMSQEADCPYNSAALLPG